jgi:GT2 family glycosyltransferase
MTPPKFSFVLVTYNNADTIKPCLASIAAFTRSTYEILLIDNSPDEETLCVIKTFLSARPEIPVRVIRPGINLGFGRACNLAVSHASGQLLFLLNPDTRLMNNAAELLAGCLENHARSLAAGPAILDSTGGTSITCRNLPNLGRIILDASGLDSFFGAYRLTRFSHDVPRQVDQIIGAALLVPRTMYQHLGGMDERFFVYFEEVDFCKRLKEAGGEIWFWPEAKVQHLSGQSCEASSVRARMIFVLRQSRKAYFRKHFGRLGGVAMDLINRLEGLEKSVVLAALWLLRGKPSDRDKAQGFWAVAKGTAP